MTSVERADLADAGAAGLLHLCREGETGLQLRRSEVQNREEAERRHDADLA